MVGSLNGNCSDQNLPADYSLQTQHYVSQDILHQDSAVHIKILGPALRITTLNNYLSSSLPRLI